MKKTTNIIQDKPKILSEIQKIKFDLNPSNYKCFISNPQKSCHNYDSALAQNICEDNTKQRLYRSQIKTINDLKIPYGRRNSQLTPTKEFMQFNTQVLLMEYDSDELYTDSIKNISQKQLEIDSKSVNSEISQESQIARSCLKMLGDQTDTDSSSPPRGISVEQSLLYNSISAFYSNYRGQNNLELNSFTIDLSRIILDGRTTIMIRNIPNKYTQNLLIDLFNKNHKNKIDFFYLPIDPKNNCNVGYAFLNFIHPKFIEDFYNEFHNKKWKLFNSEKICHICYARIQGATQLSHHFYSAGKKPRDSIK